MTGGVWRKIKRLARKGGKGSRSAWGKDGCPSGWCYYLTLGGHGAGCRFAARSAVMVFFFPFGFTIQAGVQALSSCGPGLVWLKLSYRRPQPPGSLLPNGEAGGGGRVVAWARTHDHTQPNPTKANSFKKDGRTRDGRVDVMRGGHSREDKALVGRVEKQKRKKEIKNYRILPTRPPGRQLASHPGRYPSRGFIARAQAPAAAPARGRQRASRARVG